MAILKCKMCGGDLVFEPGATVCECEYCGSKQTIPNTENEKKITLFARANRLLRSCDFDKAEGIFSSIAAEFPEEAEAYWGLVLCKYGIEYVDDPATGKKVPTCHRSSFDSVMDDPDFDQVMENADIVARAVYREQAKQIEEIRKGIIEVSGKEAPYDIFICYKETAEDGQRTIDSVLAQDVYDALTARGYRVFFSRISLEDKLGTEYEPYIFAALNSAKVMLAFGTTYDYYNAVWVKNEWSRYLRLLVKDKSKHLIPCYKNIDAYDIPKEFARLQAQDLGKIGAMQDLIRGIDKLFGKDQTKAASSQQQVIQKIVTGGSSVDALLKRGYDSLEDSAFEEAMVFFNDVLNLKAESAEAYLGLFMAEVKSKNVTEAANVFVAGDYISNRYWKRAKQYAKGELASKLDDWENVRNARFKHEVEEEEKRKAEIREARGKKIERLEIIKAQLREAKAGNYQNVSVVDKDLLEKKQKAEEDKAAAARARAEVLAARKEAEIRCYNIRQEITKKQNQMAELGFFRLKEKKMLQEQIEGMQASLIQEEADLRDKIDSTIQLGNDNKYYKDRADTLNKNILIRAKEALLKEGYSLLFGGVDIKIGALVYYGHYDTGNGIEPIRWKVLDTSDGVLLITENAIDCKPYNVKNEMVTWDTCSLRKWLNDEFLSISFNDQEQKYIISRTVTAHNNPKYSTDPGKTTEDRVFLLSIEEVMKYFKSNDSRKCSPTQYAIKRGTFVSDNTQCCWWWLRSPGKNGFNAAFVAYDGSVTSNGNIVGNVYAGLRPAIWVSLES